MYHYGYILEFACGHKMFMSFNKEKTVNELKEIEKKNCIRCKKKEQKK